MERYTDLIFDYGGVIGSSSNDEVATSVSHIIGIEADEVKRMISENAYNMQRIHLSEEDFWKRVSRGLKVDNIESLKYAWIRAVENSSKIDLEVLLFLDKLSKSYKLSLLSNTTQLYIYSPFKCILQRLFSEQIYSCDVGYRKPEKEIYDFTLARLQVKPRECIIIDDELENLAYPLSIGMDTILYEGLEDLKAKLEKKLILK